MTLFLLSNSCVGREFSYVVDCIHQLSLSIHWWFQGLQWLCFRWRFRDKPWHIIFYNSMCQPWLYFCFGFYASVMNSMTLLIPYASCRSVFFDDFKVYSDSVFTNDFGSVVTQFSLTIPCVNDDLVSSIDFMRPPWISLSWWFHASFVTQFLMMISRSTVT